MTDKPKPQESDEKQSPRSDALLWWIVGIFIVLSIAGMWTVDYYFSPEMINDKALPEAVGK